MFYRYRLDRGVSVAYRRQRFIRELVRGVIMGITEYYLEFSLPTPYMATPLSEAVTNNVLCSEFQGVTISTCMCAYHIPLACQFMRSSQY